MSKFLQAALSEEGWRRSILIADRRVPSSTSSMYELADRSYAFARSCRIRRPNNQPLPLPSLWEARRSLADHNDSRRLEVVLSSHAYCAPSLIGWKELRQQYTGQSTPAETRPIWPSQAASSANSRDFRPEIRFVMLPCGLGVRRWAEMWRGLIAEHGTVLPMRVVVTGGAGFIGANLCRALLDRPEVAEVVAP